MARVIEPPREQHDKLLTPLTKGERKVIDLFDKRLDPQWEIYIQPHLNGLRPDIVLLHPHVGIAVFEIKDWDLKAMDYYAERHSDGQLILMARDAKGTTFSLQPENPINKILLYKRELLELYCPRLNGRVGAAAITAGLIFPRASRLDVERVFGPFRNAHDGMCQYPQYYPMAGSEDVMVGNLDVIFPEHRRRVSLLMNEDIAKDLRGWLKEPFFSQEQRTPLHLDERQKALATTRTESGYRRIKGPAGSGKSLVLAARAANLAAEGKRVLVVGFNITLLNYLRDLAVRGDASRSALRSQVEFLNFHYWCARVCMESGHWQEYRQLWARPIPEPESGEQDVFGTRIPMLVQKIYRTYGESPGLPRYDAILVDEGQDFLPLWWDTLRLALKPGGEMVLVADKTQNIYGTAGAWTEDVMTNAGFRGPWIELKGSYRLPPKVVPYVKRFAETYLQEQEIDIPEIMHPNPQTEIEELHPVDLRWVQVMEPINLLDACLSEIRRMMENLRPDTSIADIVILSGTGFGRQLADHLKSKGVNVLHTFAADKMEARRQKLVFFMGSAAIKATTIHSFKGWEARHLVVVVESIQRPEDRAVVYSALTRILRHTSGSALTVVSSCPELDDFGRTWPDFVAP